MAAIAKTYSVSSPNTYVNVLSGISTFDTKKIRIQWQGTIEGYIIVSSSAPDGSSNGWMLKRGEVFPDLVTIAAGDGVWVLGDGKVFIQEVA